MRNQCVVLVRRPAGIPEAEHFAIIEQSVRKPRDGEFLVRNVFLSVDPAQRGWAQAGANYSTPIALGEVMRGLALGEVVASNADGVSAGEYLYGWFNWQEYSLASPSDILRKVDPRLVPLSAHASLLGINGLAAYIGLVRFGRPKAGEVVLVSTAAGSVGSFVGQIARNLGCRPIGLTSQPKIAAAVDRFGYEAAFDYRDARWPVQVEETVTQGVDVFFDNTGGDILDAGLRLMRAGGRIIQCGTASIASWEPPPQGLRNEREVLVKRLQWSGFVIFDHRGEFEEAAAVLSKWYADGALQFEEDVSDGIETAPGAIAELYRGQNRGKRLIRLAQG